MLATRTAPGRRFPFLALNSSNLKSSPTYRSPPTKRSLANVAIPMNDETPAIFSCFANNVGHVTVVIPSKVVKSIILNAKVKPYLLASFFILLLQNRSTLSSTPSLSIGLFDKSEKFKIS